MSSGPAFGARQVVAQGRFIDPQIARDPTDRHLARHHLSNHHPMLLLQPSHALLRAGGVGLHQPRHEGGRLRRPRQWRLREFACTSLREFGCSSTPEPEPLFAHAAGAGEEEAGGEAVGVGRVREALADGVVSVERAQGHGGNMATGGVRVKIGFPLPTRGPRAGRPRQPHDEHPRIRIIREAEHSISYTPRNQRKRR